MVPTVGESGRRVDAVQQQATIETPTEQLSARVNVEFIAKDLHLGRKAVFNLLETRQIPAIRVGHRWLIMRPAYEKWKANCGVVPASLRPF